MKYIWSVRQNEKGLNLILLLIRIGVGFMMLTHGIPKLQKFFAAEPVQFAQIMGMSASVSLALAVFAEVFCSVLIIFGLGTRLAVIPLIITMAVAAFHIHAEDPFAKQEMALHYLLFYILLLVTGSGKYSLDYLIDRQRLKLV